MNDTKLRIERSKFDLDINFNMANAISSGASGSSVSSIMADLTLPAGLKPFDFIGKIARVALDAGSGSGTEIVSNAVIISATSMLTSNSGTAHVAIYCPFEINFASKVIPCLLIYDVTSGAANAEMDLPTAGGES